MEYSIGSLSDLITGSNTPNKTSVKTKTFKIINKPLKNTVEEPVNVETVNTDEQKKIKKKKYVETVSTNEQKKIKKKKYVDIVHASEQGKIKKKKAKKQVDKVARDNVNTEEPPNVNTEEPPNVNTEEAPNVNTEEPPLNKRRQRAALYKQVKKEKERSLKGKRQHDEHESDDPPKKKMKEMSEGDDEKISKKAVFELDPVATQERASRTIFVGNVPVAVSKIQLKKYFAKFGSVESVRLRCVPLADPRITKRVAAITKQFHPDRSSLHSYIRFVNRDDALKALSANGTNYKSHHLRVEMIDSEEKPDENKAIFVGNLPFSIEEEDLWKTFKSCGNISHVRIIRDPRTQIAKGFGYVNFESSDAVALALEMDNVEIKNRTIRITRSNFAAAKKRSELKQRKNPQIVNSNGNKFGKDMIGSDEKNARPFKSVAVKSTVFQGAKFTERKKKRKVNKELLKRMKVSSVLSATGKNNLKGHA